jgi:hypothetical protein
MKTSAPMSAVPLPHVLPRKTVLVLWGFVLIGVVVVVAGIAGIASQRVWISYLVNVAFWSGLAQAGIAFSAAYRLTNGTWGETIRRVAEGFVLFIPVSAVLFLVTFLGGRLLWPWITEPIEAKAAWLNEPFFFARGAFYYLAFSAVSIRYLYVSARPEIGLIREQKGRFSSAWIERLTSGWKGYEKECEIRTAKIGRLVPVVLLSYAVITTFTGLDIVMSLDPHWYSTIYGWLYMVHAFDAGIAATIIVAILARRFFELHDHVSTKQFYDISRLLMGMCMLAGGLYWAQYLTIWYGNLGEEIERLIVRFRHEPWPAFQWGVIVALYFFPLVVFLSRSIKEKPRALFVIASVILAANWFYQFVEVAPSVWSEHSPPLGLLELGITLGFAGAVGLCWLVYARHVPLIPISAQGIASR